MFKIFSHLQLRDGLLLTKRTSNSFHFNFGFPTKPSSFFHYIFDSHQKHSECVFSLDDFWHKSDANPQLVRIRISGETLNFSVRSSI